MGCLNYKFLVQHPITQSQLKTVRLLGEYKGRQELFAQQTPQVLETLQESARIESAESSNRIEGITAPADRLRTILQKGGMPATRLEQEIAGYRDVLATVHANYADIPLSANVILQLHRDLYKFHEFESGGRWKPADNEIAEVHPDGTRVIRFRPLAAWRTPEAMQQLCENFVAFRSSGDIDSLLLIPTFVLDFLCIHPFLDGNGRMSRLLTLLLLYQSGYEVGRYISLERLIEQQKEGYYETLQDASQSWHDESSSLTRWWDYFLGVILLPAYREFESRVGVITTRRGAKREIVLDSIRRLPVRFRYADVERVCPLVSRPTIRRVFDELRAAGAIKATGRGANAEWIKVDGGA